MPGLTKPINTMAPKYIVHRIEFYICRPGGGMADQNWQLQWLRPILNKPARIRIILNSREIGMILALYQSTSETCLQLIRRTLENDTSLPWLAAPEWPTGVSLDFGNDNAWRFDSLKDVPVGIGQ